MENKKKILWITRTALLIALLITLQWSTAGTQVFAGQYITGSLVNCVLAVAVLLCGFGSGITVAIVSPVCAFLFGIGPKLVQVIPAIVLGNLVLVMVLCFLLGKQSAPLWRQGVAALAAAAAKFGMLYLAVVQVVIPALGLTIPEKQAAALRVMFSYPQFVTALIGTIVALLVLPVLRKVIK